MDLVWPRQKCLCLHLTSYKGALQTPEQPVFIFCLSGLRITEQGMFFEGIVSIHCLHFFPHFLCATALSFIISLKPLLKKSAGTSLLPKKVHHVCSYLHLRGNGEWLLMNMEFLCEVMKMFWKWIVAMVVQLCEYTKNYCIL